MLPTDSFLFVVERVTRALAMYVHVELGNRWGCDRSSTVLLFLVLFINSENLVFDVS